MKVLVSKWWRHRGVVEHEATLLKYGQVVVERDWFPPEVLSSWELLAREEGRVKLEMPDAEYKTKWETLLWSLERLEDSKE